MGRLGHLFVNSMSALYFNQIRTCMNELIWYFVRMSNAGVNTNKFYIKRYRGIREIHRHTKYMYSDEKCIETNHQIYCGCSNHMTPPIAQKQFNVYRAAIWCRYPMPNRMSAYIRSYFVPIQCFSLRQIRVRFSLWFRTNRSPIGRYASLQSRNNWRREIRPIAARIPSRTSLHKHLLRRVGHSNHNVSLNIFINNCVIIVPQIFCPYRRPMTKQRCATALRMPNHVNSHNDKLQCGWRFVLSMDASSHDMPNSLTMPIDNAIVWIFSSSLKIASKKSTQICVQHRPKSSLWYLLLIDTVCATIWEQSTTNLLKSNAENFQCSNLSVSMWNICPIDATWEIFPVGNCVVATNKRCMYVYNTAHIHTYIHIYIYIYIYLDVFVWGQYGVGHSSYIALISSQQLIGTGDCVCNVAIITVYVEHFHICQVRGARHTDIQPDGAKHNARQDIHNVWDVEHKI